MSVKSIFKTLIGTIALIVIISVLVEFFNVSVTGFQLRQMTKMAARQACVLFTQETYKTKSDRSEGAALVNNIKANDGTIYISGDFYNGKMYEKDIWKSIYGSPNFLTFCSANNSYSKYQVTKLPTGYSSISTAYPDLGVLKLAMEHNGNPPIPTAPSWDADEDSATVINYNNALKARSYYNSMFTAVNIGIPYMDDEITNKMFKWNLAQLLSNCDPDSIQKDEQGNYFVNYKGFRCYASEASIISYEYKVYDLTNSADKIEFKSVTGMSADSDGLVSSGLGTSDNSDNREDNNFVTVVGIKYRIPISYKGITPIKNIFNYVWTHEVAGLDGTVDGNLNQSWANEDLATVDNGVEDGIEYLNAGGVDGNHSGGLLDTIGSLEYTLIR